MATKRWPVNTLKRTLQAEQRAEQRAQSNEERLTLLPVLVLEACVDGPLTGRQIAKRLGVPLSEVKPVVTALTRRGWLKKPTLTKIPQSIVDRYTEIEAQARQTFQAMADEQGVTKFDADGHARAFAGAFVLHALKDDAVEWALENDVEIEREVK